MLFWKPTSRQRSATSSSAASASTCGRSSPSPTSTSSASASGVEERAQRPDQVERPLDRREPAGPADHEGPVAGSDLPAQVPGVTRWSVSFHAGRSKPYGTTAKRSARATPKRTRSSRTSSLTATRVTDSIRERSLDQTEEALPAPAEVPAEDVAMVGVHDRAGTGATGRSEQRASPSRPPWPCGCGGRPAAAP